MMGNKRKLEVITISSDDEDDDVPLKLLAKPPVVSTANGLKSHCVQSCEFCDKVFLNKYDMLVHNAKHIIVPLLKQSAHQCTQCLFYFITRQELEHHMLHTHKMKLERDDKTKTKHEDEMKPKLKLRDFSINLVDVKSMKLDEIKLKADPKVEGDIRSSTISSRLTFEDDIITDCEELVDGNVPTLLLNDLTKECKVNMNLFDKPWIDAETSTAIISEDSAEASDVGILKTVDGNETAPKTNLNDESGVTKSTHFDELVKPGMYRCKRCQELFATRFQLIQHDMSHIKIRRPRPILCEFCERYISNSRFQFKKHLLTHSPDLWNHKQRLHTPCEKCGLKYFNYKKHMAHYHDLVYCHLCYKGFDSDEERLDHIREHLIETKCMQCDLVSTAIEIEEHQRLCHRVSGVSTIKICETCCLFVKNKQNMQYIFLHNISEIGTRLTCDRCSKQFFELKLVRRLHKAAPKETGEREKKKSLSNTERLKNIQQRLKMINKLSRF